MAANEHKNLLDNTRHNPMRFAGSKNNSFLGKSNGTGGDGTDGGLVWMRARKCYVLSYGTISTTCAVTANADYMRLPYGVRLTEVRASLFTAADALITIDILEEGGKIDQETRLFDTKKNETRSMRSKEDAHDYRYFPDPDLLPLEFTDEFINELKKNIPELPDEKKKRFIEKFKLSPYVANILVSDIDTSKYFEAVIKNSDIKISTNWITGELFALLNEKNLEISKSPISAQNLSKLINLIKDGTISGKIAKSVFEIMSVGDADPQKIIEEKGLKQKRDPKE